MQRPGRPSTWFWSLGTGPFCEGKTGIEPETVLFTTYPLVAGTKRSAVSFRWTADMSFWSSIPTACAPLLLLAFAAAPASSQSIRGQLGAQSRGSIHISVTVMPQFQLLAGTWTPSLSSNASALRYSLLRLRPDGTVLSKPEPQDLGREAPFDEADGQYSLMLVVPD